MIVPINDDYLIQVSEKIAEDPEKFYYTAEGGQLAPDPERDAPIEEAWEFTEQVSINGANEIVGYFQATIKRPENFVENILALNLKNNSYTFAKDFKDFWTSMFDKHKFRKIRFYVIIGNPAEKLYDKIVTKYGGKIIGLFRDEVLFNDGTYRDVKIYELYKDSYDNVINSSGRNSSR